ncbi:MAG: succinate dehydrogenase cytochrome b subunit [bacterium]|nr:succinate dehydrogenase cytochrome b subunit [bacterium]
MKQGIWFYLSSSIGKKQVMAVTGFCCILFFLVPHFIGIMLFHLGPETFNGYAAKLQQLGIIMRSAEVFLVIIFLTHILFGLRVVVENRIARGGSYYKYSSSKKRTLSGRTMPYTGAIIIVFVMLHLFDFTLVDHAALSPVVGGNDLGLYGIVANSLLLPVTAAGYGIAVLAVGLHLSHAFQSSFQTVGMSREDFMVWIKRAGVLVGLIFAIGFLSIPVAINVKFGSF